MQTVVTMTSYPKRIKYLTAVLNHFFNTQLILPDIFYLWLSIEEFHNKENDLPIELIECCKKYNIIIKWLDKNEYCHKRWYVYPKHYQDLVISIDDDTYYDKNLIKFAKELSNTKSIYNIFGNRTYFSLYQGIHFICYFNTTDYRPSIYKTFLGQCIIPPGVFPLEAITNENIELRQKYCKLCDQCWLTPFIKFNELKVGYLPFKHNEIFEISEINKTYNILNTKLFGDITKSDLQQYIVLRLFPEKLKKFKQIFPSYITNNFDNIPLDSLLNYIK